LNPPSVRQRRYLLIVQICISVGLLSYLVSTVDIGRAGATALNAVPLLLLAGTLQTGAHLFLTALRWKVIARVLGGDLSFSPALRIVWIGAFFSQVLAGSVGGDVVRMWLFWRRCGSRRLAIHSVALERLVMVLVLLLLVLAIQPGLAARGAPITIVFSAIVVLSSLVAALAVLLSSRRLLAAYEAWLPFRMLAITAGDIRSLLTDPRRIAMLCMLSLAAHLNVVITAWLFVRALGLDITLADCMVVVPVISLAATLPISVGGWGVRESAAVSLLGLVGVSSSDALALSVLLGGALLWFAQKHRPEVDFNPLDDGQTR
jgi:glycosyltransferase 2 family protein